jgi:hypothetical protein
VETVTKNMKWKDSGKKGQIGDFSSTDHIRKCKKMMTILMKVQIYKYFLVPSIPLYITGIYCCKLLTNFEKDVWANS